MKRWLLFASALHLCCQAVLAQAPTKEAGFVVDLLKKNMATKCQADRDALPGLKGDEAAARRMSVQLNCDCGPQALDGAFPASMRATRMTQGAFQARMSGAAEICMARAVWDQVGAECSKGADPFARAGDTPSPARAEARCACVKAGVSKVADVGFAKAADASSARYAALVAAAGADQPEPQQPAPGSVIQEMMGRCRAVQAPAR